MGCLFATYLAEAGQDVALLDHDCARAARLNERGITVTGRRGRHRARPQVTCDAGAVGAVDLFMLWVKAYHTADALEQHRAALGPETVVFTAQNGLGNPQQVLGLLPAARVVAGTTTVGANLRGEDQVHHAGEGDTFIGAAGPLPAGTLETVAAVLDQAGFPTRASDDIEKIIWRKVVVNSCINPLTALLGVRNGRLLELEPARRLMEGLAREAVAVAAAQGVELDEQECLALVAGVAERTAANRSSMLQDISAGRRSEIDFINGAIASLGAAPLNRAVAELVRARQALNAIRNEPTARPRQS